jgi:hypothetical protein
VNIDEHHAPLIEETAFHLDPPRRMIYAGGAVDSLLLERFRGKDKRAGGYIRI